MPAAFTADSVRVTRQLFRGAGPLLLPVLLLASCALRHGPRTVANQPAQRVAAIPAATTPSLPGAPEKARPHRIGVVRVIGNGQRFVLIEVPPTGAGALPDGQVLRCALDQAADAATTAMLRVSRERRRPFIVADVVSGEPHVGDTVFVVPMPLPASSDPTILPTATSGVLPIVLPGPSPNAKNP